MTRFTKTREFSQACLRGLCQSYPVLLPASFFAEEASLHQRPGDADNGLS